MANQRTGTFKDPVTFGRWRLSAVTDLTPDPRNPRKHRPAQVQAIARSIEAFGFNAPVLIDKNGRILAGHGRYEAALLLGLSQIPVISLEHLSEAQAQGYMLADNRLTDRSVWDDKIVALHLKELADRALDFDIEAVGFEKPEIDLRIQSLDMTPVDAADDFEFASEPVVSMGLLCEKTATIRGRVVKPSTDPTGLKSLGGRARDPICLACCTMATIRSFRGPHLQSSTSSESAIAGKSRGPSSPTLPDGDPRRSIDGLVSGPPSPPPSPSGSLGAGLSSQIALPSYSDDRNQIAMKRVSPIDNFLLRPPAPSARHATANLRASSGPVPCFISVEHNDVHLADSGAKLRTDEQHPAMAESKVGDLHDHRHAAQQHDFMGPVELVGLARAKPSGAWAAAVACPFARGITACRSSPSLPLACPRLRRG
jgi:hypothetical protein